MYTYVYIYIYIYICLLYVCYYVVSPGRTHDFFCRIAGSQLWARVAVARVFPPVPEGRLRLEPIAMYPINFLLALFFVVFLCMLAY